MGTVNSQAAMHTDSASRFSEPMITLAGARLVPDRSGALWWPAEATLVVADLHLEKGTSFADRGVFLPPYDSRATLDKLAAVCERLGPRRVVALGDSFHDGEGPARLDAQARAVLRHLTQRHEFVWVVGNHDPERPDVFGGAAVSEYKLGPLAMRHVPGGAGFELAGHLHPCASVTVRGRRLRRRCFVGDGLRCVLPAFGAYTGGLDVFHEAFGGLFREGASAWLIGGEAVHRLALRRLARGAA